MVPTDLQPTATPGATDATDAPCAQPIAKRRQPPPTPPSPRAPRRPVAAAPGPSLTHQPALDGLRGLAVLAIMAFHAEVSGVSGAFLSVSTFFTLSGFLITGLLLAEHRQNQRISLGRFYARRARRLLPAALLAISVIALAAVAFADASQLRRLRGDALASLAYVSNWRSIMTGDSYGAIFESPSPFTHFWTLAVEEQFYLLFPVTLGLALWLARGSRRALALGIAAVAATSVCLSAMLSAESIDRAYFGTDTRLAEFLIGALLALLVERAGELTGRMRWLACGVGLVSLPVMLWLWHSADQQDIRFYEGGLAAYAFLTCAVIVAAIQPVGPVRALLGWRPLVVVGAISYVAYLLHWPVFVWFGSHTALSPWERLFVGGVLVLIAAWLSTRFLERPIRQGRWFVGRSGLWAAVGATLVTAAIVLGVTVVRDPPAAPNDFAATSERLQKLTADAVPAPDAVAPVPGVAVFGDSTAVITGFGVSDWAYAHPEQMVPIAGYTRIGCGVIENAVRLVDGVEDHPPPTCDGYLAGWEQTATATPAAISVVQFGPWDVRDLQLEPGGPFLTIGKDVAVDDATAVRLQAGVDILRKHSEVVVLVLPPDVVFDRVDGNDPPVPSPDSDPARMARFREILDDIASRYPDVVVLDLAGYIAGRADEHQLRPDGIHVADDRAREVGDWMGPAIRALYDTTVGS